MISGRVHMVFFMSARSSAIGAYHCYFLLAGIYRALTVSIYMRMVSSFSFEWRRSCNVLGL